MTVESATYINDLDDTYPAQSDSRTEGDDHIRLIKTTLANSFANFTGAAVTSTEAELNYVNVATLGTVEASKAVTADSSGNINFNNGDMTNVDINSGAIDGTTIGAASAAAGTFTTMTATTVASTTLADGTVATTQTQGDNSTKVATTAYSDNAAIGWNQTWQDVSGSRAVGTTYRNETGKPIMVAVCVQVNEAANAYAYVETATPPTIAVSQFEAVSSNANVDDFRFTHTFIVPDDHYYRVVTGTLRTWAELR